MNHDESFTFTFLLKIALWNSIFLTIVHLEKVSYLDVNPSVIEFIAIKW